MKVKINEKLICIPPYISALWDQVSFLQTEEDLESKKLILTIQLIDGKVVKIPNLDQSLIEIAFAAHLKHLEAPTQKSSLKEEGLPKTLMGMLQQVTGLSPEQLANMPIRLGIPGLPGGIEGIEMAFQHNPSNAHVPDVPPEVLEKILGMTKLMNSNDLGEFPRPEPHCNCMHCQIARAIHGIEKKSDVPEIEEPVMDEELTFKSWDIEQNGEKLFTVSDPLNPKEKYSVYLGSPLGCTCGQQNCEHIKAVLYS